MRGRDSAERVSLEQEEELSRMLEHLGEKLGSEDP